MKHLQILPPPAMRKAALYAFALLVTAACTSDDFIGDQTLNEANGQAPISFGFDVPTPTRAAGTATDAERLSYSFAVYATKTVGETVSNVFAHNAYEAGADKTNTPYWVWYNTSTAKTTTSNTSDWEYVGASGEKDIPGEGTFSLSSEQTIKYWDYAASKYEFVAYKATVGSPTITKYQTSGFTVQATAAQLAGLYIADKVTVTEANSAPGSLPSEKTKIGDIVQFTFRAAAAKVRLGIYETIPGYVVKNVSFRPNASEFTATTENAKLSGSFNGANSSASDTYTVTYDATSGIAKLATSTTAATSFDFGSFTSTSEIGTTSTAPTWATGAATYSDVLPNQDHVGNMILKVDYDLYNSTTGETIKVKGAKAVVPQAYMKWNPNYAYTYLFKISDNTNGTTGTEGTSPEGLYPITFDALSIAATAVEEGSTATVSTPAITTYQEGSVSSAGITYAATDKPIYITINTNGTLETLTAANTKLYTVADGTTEADLMLSSVTKTDATGLTVLAAAETVNSVTFTSGTTAKFTPASAGTYAIEYTDSDSNKHYKVIVVAAAS